MRSLFLRCLIPSALFQVLFGLTDYALFPEALGFTLPARLALVVGLLCLFGLTMANLIVPGQRIALATTLTNGLASLTLFGIQRDALLALDGLYLVFGLALYTVPKVSPLSFASSCVGSWVSVAWYLGLAGYVRPPPAMWHTALALGYLMPVIFIFNILMYHYECSARERFVLRDRLRQEQISVAVARAATPAGSRPRERAVLPGMLLWLLLTAVGWASIHDVIAAPLTVKPDTAWAWFSHCAGISVFMLMVTRQTRWLFVFPTLGGLVLWGMAQAIPERWIILSAHGVGYSLLGLAAIVTLGAFNWFMAAWQQLVGFLRRTCLLYPQLRAGLQRDFPLLETIARDYTSSFQLDSKPSHDKEAVCAESPDSPAATMPMPMPKPDMCFFCGTNGAAHYIPCCEAWGPYAQWRMELNCERGHGKPSLTSPPPTCTPYSALQLKLKQAEVELALAAWDRRHLERQLAQATAEAMATYATLRKTQADASFQAQAAARQEQQYQEAIRVLERRLADVAAAKSVD